MKQLFLLLLSLLVWGAAGAAQAQTIFDDTPDAPLVPPSRWTLHVDSLFQPLDRAPVGTGLLANYGVALKDYTRFQGTALDSTNRLRGLPEWRLLYGAMQTSTYNNNASLPLLSTANGRITQAIIRQQAGQALDVAVLLARYERFRDDAGTAGLITVSNNQLHDNPGRTRSPYEQRTLLAVCPVVGQVATRTPQLRLATALRFLNAAPGLGQPELDAGDGQGYRPATWNQPVVASYSAVGTYRLKVRAIYNSPPADHDEESIDPGLPVTYYSQFDLYVARPAGTAARTLADTEVDFPAQAGQAAGKAFIHYAPGHTTLMRPLIVAEGYDKHFIALHISPQKATLLPGRWPFLLVAAATSCPPWFRACSRWGC